MRLQTQHNDKQSSLSSVIPCVFVPFYEIPVVSSLRWLLSVSASQTLWFLFLFSHSLTLLEIGSASLSFLPSFPPPSSLCFIQSKWCLRATESGPVACAVGVWCYVAVHSEDILGRAGDTPPSCALPLAPVHVVSQTRLPRALTVWLALVAQRQTLHLRMGPATPLCVTQHTCKTF